MGEEKWNHMAGTALQITLYQANDEIKQTFTRTIIPWGVLKKAITLTRSLDEENITEKDMDSIAGLVVEAFGNQFTIKDLDESSDIGEMLSVLKNIVTRASMLVQANPTIPPSRKKRRSS